MKLKNRVAEVYETICHQMVQCLQFLRLVPRLKLEPSQRNQYFDDFERAVKFDAIEAGVLPVLRALYNLGASPKFSCEGHATPTGFSPPYLVCWLDPELAKTLPTQVEKLLLAPLHYHWYVESEPSKSSRLACIESGSEGLFLAIHRDGRPHRLMPASDSYTEARVKEWVTADLAEVSQRLDALDLPRRLGVPAESQSLLSRVLLTVLIAPPVVLGTLTFFIVNKVANVAGWVVRATIERRSAG